MKGSILIYVICAVSILIFNSCSTSYQQSFAKSENVGRYTGIFPYRNDSKQLDQISSSIQRVSTLALYEVYLFSENSNIKAADLDDEFIKANFVKKTGMDKSTSGTAVLIYSDNGKVGLLTCAHVVDFPDTIISYFSNENGTYTDKVASIAFKKKEFVYIAGFPKGSEVKIIFMDRNSDLALLGQNYSEKYLLDFPVLSCGYGKAKELDLASFVYVVGFPLNYKMVSQAIVSSPNYDKNGSFFIDAVINRGYSGGAVLAVNSETSRFEWVGIVDWVAEENQNILEPPSADESLVYNPLVPYKGELYAKQMKVIKYGITKIVSMEEIENFLMKNKNYFINAGYSFSIYK